MNTTCQIEYVSSDSDVGIGLSLIGILQRFDGIAPT